MSQLLKHYMINRDNGQYIIDEPHGYVYLQLPELQITYTLSKDNGVLYCLSTCADVLEYNVTVSAEDLVNYQNNPNITITNATERTVEVFIVDNETNETTTQTVYDVVYTEPYVVTETEGEGLKVITQQEWDDTITEFDNRQEEKRYNILRDIRDKILEVTDWIVIRDLEQQEVVSVEFKTWRQELRDLPNGVEFPISFPTIPTELEAHTEIQELYSRFDEVRQISMVNDPLSALPSV